MLWSEPCKAYGASRSESEPDSASKREIGSGQPSGAGEASMGDEDTGKGSRPASRGCWGQRVPRERRRNLRDPACGGSCPEVTSEIHNW